jgi:protein-S-isoprenylcysteine O-methyltransferase Ste14
MEMKPIEAGIAAGDGVLGAVRRSLDQSRLYDWAMRLPIVTYSLLVLGNDMLGFYQQILAAPAMLLAPGGIIATLARVSQWMFIGLLAIFPLVRFRPVMKSQDMLPRLGALITVCILPTFMLLERAPTSLAFNLASLTMSFAANVMAVLTLSFLGRSFSVMPEARRLVTGGPYELVRHPLYVCEILGLLAILLQYRSLPAIGLFALCIAFQLARARWEETVLARAFPEFAAYRQRTPFLLPRFPGRHGALGAAPLARRRLAVVLACAFGLFLLVTVVLPRLVG